MKTSWRNRAGVATGSQSHNRTVKVGVTASQVKWAGVPFKGYARRKLIGGKGEDSRASPTREESGQLSDSVGAKGNRFSLWANSSSTVLAKFEEILTGHGNKTRQSLDRS